MPKIRVLVVEDSLTVRKRMVDVLSSDPDLDVVGEAEDGQRGIELCESLRPDVITLDMMLPVMSGLAATEYIMAYCPTPILIVSASMNRGEVFKTYEALAAGALDVLDKDAIGDDGDWEQRLISTVKLISRIRVITHPRGRLSSPQLRPTPLSSPTIATPTRSPTAGLRAVAIGVSTGGPAALIEILRKLPIGFPLPLIVVIHISKLFAPAFAEWLDAQTPIRVSYARDGEPIPPVGSTRMLLAPPDVHLVVRGDRLRYSQEAERHSCRPSVDVLFSSVATELGERAVACLLTGMGKDGARGLQEIRNAGGRTIAQDESSSVVFGMPREAILLGAAEQVLPLDRIAPALAALAKNSTTRTSS